MKTIEEIKDDLFASLEWAKKTGLISDFGLVSVEGDTLEFMVKPCFSVRPIYHVNLRVQWDL